MHRHLRAISQRIYKNAFSGRGFSTDRSVRVVITGLGLVTPLGERDQIDDLTETDGDRDWRVSELGRIDAVPLSGAEIGAAAFSRSKEGSSIDAVRHHG